jgi:hypothetical protein
MLEDPQVTRLRDGQNLGKRIKRLDATYLPKRFATSTTSSREKLCSLPVKTNESLAKQLGFGGTCNLRYSGGGGKWRGALRRRAALLSVL